MIREITLPNSEKPERRDIYLPYTPFDSNYYLDYQRVPFNARRVGNVRLLDYFVKGRIQTLAEEVIPEQLRRYHKPGFYLSLFEEILGMPNAQELFWGLPNSLRVERTKLVFSEEYTALMSEIKRRGLAGELREMRRNYERGRAPYVELPRILTGQVLERDGKLIFL